MEKAIEKIDIDQALKYLGYRGSCLGEDLRQSINEQVGAIESLGPAHWTCRTFALNGLEIVGTNYKLYGKSAKEWLEDCQGIVFMAATLGPQVDRWIGKESVKDLSRSLILDALASAAIEGVCDTIEEEMRLEMTGEGAFLGPRFSPGYGDLDLSFSRIICHLLDTPKTIGLSLSTEVILLPRKSITAFMGISKNEKQNRRKSCQNCQRINGCPFKERGLVCYGTEQ